MTATSSANVRVVIENVREIPRLTKLIQIDGETPEAVALRYPGCTMYQLAQDYTLRVWVEL